MPIDYQRDIAAAAAAEGASEFIKLTAEHMRVHLGQAEALKRVDTILRNIARGAETLTSAEMWEGVRALLVGHDTFAEACLVMSRVLKKHKHSSPARCAEIAQRWAAAATTEDALKVALELEALD